MAGQPPVSFHITGSAIPSLLPISVQMVRSPVIVASAYHIVGSSDGHVSGEAPGFHPPHRSVTRRPDRNKASSMMATRSNLSQSDDFHRMLFEQSAEAQFVADGAGRLLHLNPATAALLGEPAEQLLGRSLLEMIDETAQRRELIRCLDEAGLVREAELTLTLRDGSNRELLLSANRVQDPSTPKGCFAGTLRDITLHRRTCDLLSSLTRFPAEDPNPLLRVARNGTIRYVNRAAEPLLELWGTDMGGLLPRPWLELVRTALRARQPHSGELEAGGRNWLVLCVPISNEEYVHVYTADVTELRRAELLVRRQADDLERANAELIAANQRLEQEATRLELILRGIGDGAIVTDMNHRVLMINDVARHLFKVSTGHGTGSSIASLLGRCVPSAEELRHQIELCERDRPRELLIELVEPRPLVLRVVASAWHDPSGAPAGRVLILRDVTREREVDRLKTAFIGSVSHELRTPLTSIKGFTRALLDDPELPASTSRQFLQILDAEASRLGALIEDLLAMARLAEHQPLAHLPVELEPLIRFTCAALAPSIEQAGLTLELKLAPDLPHPLGDAEALQRVLINLLDNAIKFTPAGGRIELHAAREPAGVAIQVRDTGIGIPQPDLPHIFERFYRAPRPGTEIAGTGLGLAIARELVELHGGSIEVASEPNRGACFTIHLPLGSSKDTPQSIAAHLEFRPYS